MPANGVFATYLDPNIDTSANHELYAVLYREHDNGIAVGTYAQANILHAFAVERRAGQYVELVPPDGTSNNVFATGINNDGTIVGTTALTGNSALQLAWVLRNGTFSEFTFNNMSTAANAINNHGEIVGQYYDSTNISHGFALKHDQFTSLDDPNAVEGMVAFGVNDSGVVVGTYYDKNFIAHGFLATR